MSERLTPERLAEIRARAEAATEGPWAWAQTADKGYGASVGAGVFADHDQECREPLSGDLSEHDGYYVDEHICEMAHQRAAPDAAFIAHARADIPALLAELDAVTAELDRWREMVEGHDTRTLLAQIDTLTHERDEARTGLVDMRRRCEAAQRQITSMERAYRKSRVPNEQDVERAAESLKQNAYLGDTRDIPVDYVTLARRALEAALSVPSAPPAIAAEARVGDEP